MIMETLKQGQGIFSSNDTDFHVQQTALEIALEQAKQASYIQKDLSGSEEIPQWVGPPGWGVKLKELRKRTVDLTSSLKQYPWPKLEIRLRAWQERMSNILNIWGSKKFKEAYKEAGEGNYAKAEENILSIQKEVPPEMFGVIQDASVIRQLFNALEKIRQRQQEILDGKYSLVEAANRPETISIDYPGLPFPDDVQRLGKIERILQSPSSYQTLEEIDQCLNDRSETLKKMPTQFQVEEHYRQLKARKDEAVGQLQNALRAEAKTLSTHADPDPKQLVDLYQIALRYLDKSIINEIVDQTRRNFLNQVASILLEMNSRADLEKAARIVAALLALLAAVKLRSDSELQLKQQIEFLLEFESKDQNQSVQPLPADLSSKGYAPKQIAAQVNEIQSCLKGMKKTWVNLNLDEWPEDSVFSRLQFEIAAYPDIISEVDAINKDLQNGQPIICLERLQELSVAMKSSYFGSWLSGRLDKNGRNGKGPSTPPGFCIIESIQTKLQKNCIVLEKQARSVVKDQITDILKNNITNILKSSKESRDQKTIELIKNILEQGKSTTVANLVQQDMYEAVNRSAPKVKWGRDEALGKLWDIIAEAASGAADVWSNLHQEAQQQSKKAQKADARWGLALIVLGIIIATGAIAGVVVIIFFASQTQTSDTSEILARTESIDSSPLPPSETAAPTFSPVTTAEIQGTIDAAVNATVAVQNADWASTQSAAMTTTATAIFCQTEGQIQVELTGPEWFKPDPSSSVSWKIKNTGTLCPWQTYEARLLTNSESQTSLQWQQEDGNPKAGQIEPNEQVRLVIENPQKGQIWILIINGVLYRPKLLQIEESFWNTRFPQKPAP